MRHPFAFSSLLAGLLLGAPHLAPAAPTDAPSRGTTLPMREPRLLFNDALQRVKQNLPDLPDPPALRTYLLYDYLTAARLRRDLAQAPIEPLDASIEAFLVQHAAEPVTRGLRHDWLVSLAHRRRWELFLPRATELTEPPLACARLSGRLAIGDTGGLAAEALLRWLLPQRQPPECSEVFAWLKSQDMLTAALAEQRARAALNADNPSFAREAAADAELERQPALLQWAYLLETPKAALTVLATHPALPVEADALGAGFDKLSRSDAATAWALLPALLARTALPPLLQSRMRRAVALGLAYDRRPEALGAFAALAPESIDAAVQEWRIRAALWSGDFAKALSWLEQMPPSLAALPRWRYWRARSLQASGDAAAAAALYADLASVRDFYGYLAADRSRRSYQLHARDSADNAAVQSALAQRPGMLRARELYECDLGDDAVAEWSAVVGGADAPLKVQAAHLAAHWEWYYESIVMLAQAGEWDDVRLRYPRPYAPTVVQAAKLARIPPDLIWSVMRQESLYRKDAVSRADARGIMQMLPSTAAQVARRWQLPAPGRKDLFDPAVAIPLGAAHLRELLDRHGEQLLVTLAAYNAGPNAVSRWLPALGTVDADVWLENIPFNETRAYVQHILEHLVAFAFVADEDPPRLSALLPAVGPGM